MKTIHLWVKPKSKALWVRLEDLNWLCAYAADQHHFQGIARTCGVGSKTAVAAKRGVVWNFNTKRWDVTNMNQSVSLVGDFMNEYIYEIVVDKYLKSSIGNERATARGQSARRRQASKRFLDLWCEAAAAGKRQEFEHEWGCSVNQTTGIDGSPADMLRGDSEGAESQIACECPEPIMTTDVVTEELMTADAAEQQTAAAASIVPETDGVL